MELAGLEPATSWVRSRRSALRFRRKRCLLAGTSCGPRGRPLVPIAADIRGFPFDSGTLRDECLNGWAPPQVAVKCKGAAQSRVAALARVSRPNLLWSWTSPAYVPGKGGAEAQPRPPGSARPADGGRRPRPSGGRSALHVNTPERLSGTPDQLVNNGRGWPHVLDDACALPRVVRQGLHIASGPSHWNFGTVAI
jgi:hypothetical protein